MSYERLEVEFSVLDKLFAKVPNTSLIQKHILSMCLRFPDGIPYGDITLGELFDRSSYTMNHLIGNLNEIQKLIIVVKPKSKYRLIFLNPFNSTLTKLAMYQQSLPCGNRQSKKCLLCYFRTATLLKLAMSLKEGSINKSIGVKDCVSNNKVLPVTRTQSGSKSKKKTAMPFKPPTEAAVLEYAASKDFPDIDAKQFIDYYAANNWHDADGKPVKSWKQRVITWRGRRKSKKAEPPDESYEPTDEQFDKLLQDAGKL